MNANNVTGPYITRNKETATAELIENYVLPGTHAYIHVWTSTQAAKTSVNVQYQTQSERQQNRTVKLWWMFTKLQFFIYHNNGGKQS
jgi:hypothetical protein